MSAKNGGHDVYQISGFIMVYLFLTYICFNYSMLSFAVCYPHTVKGVVLK